nr:histidinol-phosphatase HisJ [Anoxybacillus flavithermus]
MSKFAPKGVTNVRDGHIHTPFCPHGSKDALHEYIEKAISLGYTDISFTEHAPLPKGFIDPTPYQDSAMKEEQLASYVSILQSLKKQYERHIRIRIGLEVDFILGYEQKTKEFLNEIGPQLDDSILSVHFLHVDDQYMCIDYSEDMFGDIVTSFGCIERVYDAYYRTVLASVVADLGVHKPKRIGHITLVRKFHRAYPCEYDATNIIAHILDEMKNRQLELDYNGAGAVKPLCLEPYPPHWVVKEAVKRGIPLVYGSDAHSVAGLHQGIEHMLI